MEERRTKMEAQLSSPRETHRELGADAATPDSALLHQQCWLWNRDASRNEGNLLVEYGFDRAIPPQREWGSSCYTYVLPSNEIVRLWEFGVMYAEPKAGGVFLQRGIFDPKLIPSRYTTAVAWSPEQIAGARSVRAGDRKRMLTLLPTLLAWIGSYERWVLDNVGHDYRRECLSSFDETACPPDRLPSEWWNAAHKWREWLSAQA
jgi:hypothetical protein